MKLANYFSKRGNQAALSRALNVPASLLSAWASGDRPVPIPRCVPIEQATDGKVTRRELRSDWAQHWPELSAESARRRVAKAPTARAA